MDIFDIDLIRSLLIQHGYLLMLTAVFLDNAGLPLPGELVLLAFGFLTRTGHLDPDLGVMAAGVGAMAGDNLSYWLGRLGGPRVVDAYCRVTLGSGDCASKAVAFYHRWGRSAVVVGRFVMGLRAFLVPLAGSVRMPYWPFLVFDAMGALVWSTIYIGLGRALGSQVESFSPQFRGGSLLLVATLAITFLAYLALKLWKRRHFSTGDKCPERNVLRQARVNRP